MTLESLENAFEGHATAIVLTFGKPHLMRKLLTKIQKNRTKIYVR